MWLKTSQSKANKSARCWRKHPSCASRLGKARRVIDGFRSSHEQALTAHQMMVRLQSRQQIAFFEDIHMVALLTQKPDRTDEFIKGNARGPRFSRRCAPSHTVGIHQ